MTGSNLKERSFASKNGHVPRLMWVALIDLNDFDLDDGFDGRR